MPELKRDAAIPPAPADARSSQPSAGLNEPLVRLKDVLTKAQVQNPTLLSSALRADPVRADMNAVLVQLGPGHALPLLNCLATADLPNRQEVLDALLTGELPGSVQALRATLQAVHRQDLLAAIFHPDRVHGLRRACQSLTKEPT